MTEQLILSLSGHKISIYLKNFKSYKIPSLTIIKWTWKSITEGNWENVHMCEYSQIPNRSEKKSKEKLENMMNENDKTT